MTRPRNRVYQSRLEVAVELKTAPSFMLLGKGKNPTTVKWSPRDRALFASVLRLKNEKCPHCGTPAWWGQSAHSEIEFHVDFSVCNACAHQAEVTKDIKLAPGEWAHVHAVDLDGGTDGLPSRSEGYRRLSEPVYNIRQE